ncbi:MAG: hypothetical protein ACREL9_11545 [Gemmatimonadales bacterium]
MSRLALLGLLALAAACAPLPPASPDAVAKARLFTPTPSRARLYVLCKSSGSRVFPVVLNGRLIGGLSWGTYLMVEIPPGTYTLQSHTEESLARLEFEAEPERVYYVELYRRRGVWDLLGFFEARVALRQVDEIEGRKAVAERRLVESEAGR